MIFVIRYRFFATYILCIEGTRKLYKQNLGIFIIQYILGTAPGSCSDAEIGVGVVETCGASAPGAPVAMTTDTKADFYVSAQTVENGDFARSR